MFKKNLFASSAFGLCLAMAPLMAGAASAQAVDERPRDEQPADGRVAVFVPLVDACVSTPSVETCQQVRAVIAECANELAHEGCSVLFEKADEVFDDPARQAESQATLSRTAQAIAAMEFPESQDAAIDEAARADAERTLLRGDENLMSHSPPPLLEGTAPPAERR